MRASIYDYSASIKIDNSVEFQLGKEELPRDNSSIIQRMQYTFPKAGIHTIKLYDPNTTVKRLIIGESQSDPQETTIKELKFLGYSVKGATTNTIENYTCFNHVALEKIVIPEGVIGDWISGVWKMHRFDESASSRFNTHHQHRVLELLQLAGDKHSIGNDLYFGLFLPGDCNQGD